MKKISRESVAAIIIGIGVITANSYHVLEELIANPRGNVFTGIAHYFADYFLYVSHIAQGAHGAWFMTDHLFTNESMSPTWIYWIYTILGKANIIGIHPFAAYNISIILFATFLLILWWKIIRDLFQKQPFTQVIAFLFITTASNFPGLGDFWFSPTPALNRLGGVPHQFVQTILLLLTVRAFISAGNTPKQSPAISGILRYALLCVVSFLAATASPIQMLLMTISTGIFLIIPLRSGNTSYIAAFAAVALPAFFGAYLTNTEFARQPILAAAKLWENSQPVSVSVWQFILALGPVCLLFPFGIHPYLKKITPLRALLGIFTALSLTAFFSAIPALLGTTPVRWLSPASIGALYLVAALGFMEISRFISQLIPLPRVHIRALLLLIYIAFTVPSLYTQVLARITPLRSDRSMQTLNHVPAPVIEALTAIKTAPGNGVVVTDPSFPYDVLVPVISGKRSFTGHPVHTLYPQVKEELRRTFFSGFMTQDQARQFIKDHTISYILSSRQATRILERYPFLTLLFQNDTASVYVATGITP